MLCERLVVLLALSSLFGCSAPAAVADSSEVSLPSYRYPVFQGEWVDLVVLDHRGERAYSEKLVATTEEVICGSMLESGAIVAPGGKSRLEVRIHQYASELVGCTWVACVEMQATVVVPSGSFDVPIERCIKRRNELGKISSREALRDAYSEALAELLSKIDALGVP